MRIDYDAKTGVYIEPEGMFDYGAGAACLEKIERYISEYGPVQITVDFRQTTFMDSSGIGALIAMMRKQRPEAPAMKLIHPSPTVYKLMEVCHLHRLFQIEQICTD